MSDYEARVKAGMALLDEKYPGWRGHIDVDMLVMSDCEACILGQLYRTYDHGARHITGLDRMTRSFFMSDHGFYSDNIDDYGELQAAWIAALEAPK